MGGLSKTIVGLKRGLWTLEEDKILTQYISSHGEGHWDLLAKSSGLRRTGKSCRLRWLNYLKPDIKRGKLTLEEQLRILQLHSMWGNRWSKIAQFLPGRTDNEIKNYWRTRVQRQAHHLKIAANSKAFQEVIQHFWIPRLLQKVQKSSPPSPSATLSQNSTTTLINHSTFNTSSFSSSEYPTSCPIQATSNSDFCTTFQKGNCNQLNISRNDSTFSILSTEASFEENMGEDFLERESNFIDNGDLEDGLWNMDETWELLKLQEGSMYDLY